MIFGCEEEQWKALGGGHTAREIMQQPGLWLRTYDLVKALEPRIKTFMEQQVTEDTRIIFTGAGTSDYVGAVISSFIDKTVKAQVCSIASTDIVSNPEDTVDRDKKTILVSFARSGNSPESIGAFRLFQKHVSQISHVVITCNKDGSLAKMARENEENFVIVLPEETNDAGFAMTSSFSCMLLTALLFFDIERIDQNRQYVEAVSRQGQDILDHQWMQVKNLLTEDVKRIIYLGSGCMRGLAKELSLKNMELTNGKIPAMQESVLGFRHGPKTFMNDNTLVLILTSMSSYTRQYIDDLIEEISHDSGSHKLAVINIKGWECRKAGDVTCLAADPGPIPEIYAVFNYLLYGQMLALFNSVRIGVTPDNPCPDGSVNRVVKGVTLYDEAYEFA